MWVKCPAQGHDSMCSEGDLNQQPCQLYVEKRQPEQFEHLIRAVLTASLQPWRFVGLSDWDECKTARYQVFNLPAPWIEQLIIWGMHALCRQFLCYLWGRTTPSILCQVDRFPRRYSQREETDTDWPGNAPKGDLKGMYSTILGKQTLDVRKEN